MAVTIKKTTDRPEHRTPGTWKECTKVDGTVGATVTCPKCGVNGSLDDHEIHNTGRVDPSLQCPDCDFHDYVILEGWLGINGAHLTNVM